MIVTNLEKIRALKVERRKLIRRIGVIDGRIDGLKTKEEDRKFAIRECLRLLKENGMTAADIRRARKSNYQILDKQG